MEVVETDDGVTIVNDAYNASPESMKAALQSLKQMTTGRRGWAVLGEMRELGVASLAEHEAVGRLVVRLGVQRLVVVGDQARPILSGALGEGSGSPGTETILVPDVDAAADLLNREVAQGDVVLVKASRAVGLEQLVPALMTGRSEVGEPG
jgi:UDP-N-acetylmuramoyl-tripeptide--D-alanyl-D-alanine ligase